MMRHAQSEWNIKCDAYITAKDIAITEFNKIPHSFSTSYEKPEQVDAALSEEGIKQCLDGRAEFEQNYPNIKYILCSPYRRTIQTMTHMFADYKNKPDSKNTIMFPLISEALASLGDMAFETENYKEKLKDECDWSFQTKENYEDPKIWFLYNIDESQGENKLKWEMINHWKTHQDKDKLFEYWAKSERKLESNVTERCKTNHAREKIGEFCQENNVQDDELLVVSHFTFLNFFISQNFDENSTPQDKRFIKNLEILKYDI